ncbi:AEC family transporter [Litoreibacter janthinus]|uniref:Malonate transporter n=1 Tax=Litoreibacter janthinus TaxID=670154 RepID=A0A1I6G8P2_9RHOB|nr:AEC family transporter [Litoreibacter janthinus]SFR38586.1 hypothetical protein SAMN04488002_1069 [Litoreibacter janthinus]
MDILTVLFNPILPVFAIMAGGFVAGRAGWVSLADARVINRFAMTVLLPIFVFNLIGTAPMARFPLGEVVLYAAVEVVIFAGAFLIARYAFSRDPAESVLLAFCCIFVNNALYVLPISILLYGPDGVLPVTSVVTVDSIVTFAGAMIALQWIGMGKAQPRAVLMSLARTPLILAILCGVVVGLAQIQLPGPIMTFVQFNGAGAAPVALFALGVVLSQTKFEWDRVVISFTLIKLFAFPLLLWAVFMSAGKFDGDGWAQNSQFLMASAGPAGAMGFSLALLHNIRSDAIAQIVVWTSLLTLVSLAVLA